MAFLVWEDGICGHCGDKSEGKDDPHYRLTCPKCYRDGCHECMPLGRSCECPECEEGEG